MNISLISEQARWEDFINAHAVTTFMQSWAWGEFEEHAGHRVFRWFVYDESNEPIAACQAFLIRAKKGTFLYIPHGPICAKNLIAADAWHTASYRLPAGDINLIKVILEQLHRVFFDTAKEYGCHFIRLNSSLPQSGAISHILTHLGYREAPLYLTSENAAVVDISLDTADVMAQMRKTTRYLIRKAQKDGITVSVDTTGETLDQFLSMYKATVMREKFVGFTSSYLKKEFEAFHKYNNVVIINAYHRASIEACAMIIFNNQTAFYHQGASNHPKVPASYILQWYAMQEAKKRDCRYYNFWGTYIPNRTPRSWKGLTLFKAGFGTSEWKYLPTMDYPLHFAYHLTKAFELVLRLKRGV
ncbi:MAG TPA: peptidoglycan bridge formation glycyltransferase FemA/FemB family protein [Candidatus Woesebacteria bacterium]|nr:peptidoglycan bridge formation glycyltransferase FemA/FemB family protein [Candidatus Woesebacteria bacterium]HNS94945.1 peptidoglycan bridge formation glycyltransferase FemA/FemB family protein [Candidatus Woesebacteria bacterium]